MGPRLPEAPGHPALDAAADRLSTICNMGKLALTAADRAGQHPALAAPARAEDKSHAPVIALWHRPGWGRV
jgi:hypothetical protein